MLHSQVDTIVSVANGADLLKKCLSRFRCCGHIVDKAESEFPLLPSSLTGGFLLFLIGSLHNKRTIEASRSAIPVLCFIASYCTLGGDDAMSARQNSILSQSELVFPAEKITPVVLVGIAYSQAACLICFTALDQALLNGATVTISNCIRQPDIHSYDASFLPTSHLVFRARLVACYADNFASFCVLRVW